VEHERLVEEFANYRHELWAFTMQNQGWKYGREFNSEEKVNLFIRPYEALPVEVSDS